MVANCRVWSAVLNRFLSVTFCVQDGGLIYWQSPNGWELVKESTIKNMKLSFYPG